MGQRHKDTRMTGSVIKENAVLNEFFFGKSRNELLTCEKFLDFQKQLQAEVIKMEVILLIRKIRSLNTLCLKILFKI
jgi:hypothetical protein